MTADENIEIVRRIFKEVFDLHNVGVVDEFYAPSYVYHSPGEPDSDREGLKQGFTAYLTAFPDAHMVLEDIFAAGDKVASRFNCLGTHRGPYNGIPPTNKQILMSAILIQRLEGGKVVEDWEWGDSLGFMQQLGLISIPDFTLAPPSTIKHTKRDQPHTPEENIVMMKKFCDDFAKGDPNLLVQVYSPDYVYHSPGNQDMDLESARAMVASVMTALPDRKMTLEDMVATTDKAAYRLSVTGTHLGELLGVAPTGKKITVSGITIGYFNDGKIVEEWEWADILGLMRQIGLIPAAVGA